DAPGAALSRRAHGRTAGGGWTHRWPPAHGGGLRARAVRGGRAVPGELAHEPPVPELAGTAAVARTVAVAGRRGRRGGARPQLVSVRIRHPPGPAAGLRGTLDRMAVSDRGTSEGAAAGVRPRRGHPASLRRLHPGRDARLNVRLRTVRDAWVPPPARPAGGDILRG